MKAHIKGCPIGLGVVAGAALHTVTGNALVGNPVASIDIQTGFKSNYRMLLLVAIAGWNAAKAVLKQLAALQPQVSTSRWQADSCTNPSSAEASVSLDPQAPDPAKAAGPISLSVPAPQSSISNVAQDALEAAMTKGDLWASTHPISTAFMQTSGPTAGVGSSRSTMPGTYSGGHHGSSTQQQAADTRRQTMPDGVTAGSRARTDHSSRSPLPPRHKAAGSSSSSSNTHLRQGYAAGPAFSTSKSSTATAGLGGPSFAAGMGDDGNTGMNSTHTRRTTALSRSQPAAAAGHSSSSSSRVFLEPYAATLKSGMTAAWSAAAACCTDSLARLCTATQELLNVPVCTAATGNDSRHSSKGPPAHRLLLEVWCGNNSSSTLRMAVIITALSCIISVVSIVYAVTCTRHAQQKPGSVPLYYCPYTPPQLWTWDHTCVAQSQQL